ncbi:unnamed protein product [Caretta caretta]
MVHFKASSGARTENHPGREWGMNNTARSHLHRFYTSAVRGVTPHLHGWERLAGKPFPSPRGGEDTEEVIPGAPEPGPAAAEAGTALGTRRGGGAAGGAPGTPIPSGAWHSKPSPPPPSQPGAGMWQAGTGSACRPQPVRKAPLHRRCRLPAGRLRALQQRSLPRRRRRLPALQDARAAAARTATLLGRLREPRGQPALRPLQPGSPPLLWSRGWAGTGRLRRGLFLRRTLTMRKSTC